MIQEILGWGLEGTLKIMYFQTPVMRDDLFCLNVKEQGACTWIYILQQIIARSILMASHARGGRGNKLSILQSFHAGCGSDVLCHLPLIRATESCGIYQMASLLQVFIEKFISVQRCPGQR